jgi:hypothetical protein
VSLYQRQIYYFSFSTVAGTLKYPPQDNVKALYVQVVCLINSIAGAHCLLKVTVLCLFHVLPCIRMCLACGIACGRACVCACAPHVAVPVSVLVHDVVLSTVPFPVASCACDCNRAPDCV